MPLFDIVIYYNVIWYLNWLSETAVAEATTNQVQSSQENSDSPSEISSLLKLDIPSTVNEDITLPAVNNGLLDVSKPSTSSFVGKYVEFLLFTRCFTDIYIRLEKE